MADGYLLDCSPHSGPGCFRVSDIVVGLSFTEYTLEGDSREREDGLERGLVDNALLDSLSKQTRSEAQTEAFSSL